MTNKEKMKGIRVHEKMDVPSWIAEEWNEVRQAWGTRPFPSELCIIHRNGNYLWHTFRQGAQKIIRGENDDLCVIE